MADDPFEHVTMSIEEAQDQIADMYDGDYLLIDLLAKSGSLGRAALVLFHDSRQQPMNPKNRTLTFQGETGGKVKLSRSAKQGPEVTAYDLTKIVMTVQGGKITGFSEG